MQHPPHWDARSSGAIVSYILCRLHTRYVYQLILLDCWARAARWLSLRNGPVFVTLALNQTLRRFSATSKCFHLLFSSGKKADTFSYQILMTVSGFTARVLVCFPLSIRFLLSLKGQLLLIGIDKLTWLDLVTLKALRAWSWTHGIIRVEE